MGIRGQHRNKRDANEQEIVNALEAHGFSVKRLDTPVDLLLGKFGHTWIAEVKVEGKKLNANQVEFFKDWRGNKTVFRSVQDVDDFAREINAAPIARIPHEGSIS
jgi:Holliday junction resolvase